MFHVQSLKARRGARAVFREVGFTLGAGELLLITGANGSGKSSLLRVLAGLIPAAAGSMTWDNKPVDQDWDAHRRRLHYIGHLDALKPELTVQEMLDYWRTLNAAPPSAPTILDLVGLAALADRPVRYLSAGQRRRLTLARLGLRHAPLWLLDEPTTALDHAGQIILQDLIAAHRAKGGMAVIATHHGMDVGETKTMSMIS